MSDTENVKSEEPVEKPAPVVEDVPEEPENKTNIKAKAVAAAKASHKKGSKRIAGKIKPSTALQISGTPKKKKSPVTHPRTLDMAIEAIEKLNDTRGSSVQAIRTFILQQYDTVRPDMIKSMLKAGLQKGLDDGLLIRPRGQVAGQVLGGRYKVTKKGEKEAFVITKRSKKSAVMRRKPTYLPPPPKKGAKKPKKPVIKKEETDADTKASPKKKAVATKAVKASDKAKKNSKAGKAKTPATPTTPAPSKSRSRSVPVPKVSPAKSPSTPKKGKSKKKAK